MTDIGQMRHRISIQQKTRGASDGAGGYGPDTWSTIDTVWARIEPQAGREFQSSDRTTYRLTHKITIRKNNLVKAHHRIQYNNRTFAIFSVKEIDERRSWTELLCEEDAPS